jgi:universal stress protein E
MEPFRSILVDVDATDRAQPALERAARLARSSGARLTIVDVTGVPSYARPYLPAGLSEEMAGRRREDLARLAEGVAGVPVETRLLEGRGATALVDEAAAAGHDLVVREGARDLVAPRREPSGAVSVELLRRCPCAVLLVGPGGAPEHPRIAAAVDTSAEAGGEADHALNARIAEAAALMAGLEGGSVTLLHAWEVLAETTVRRLASPDGYAGYLADARRRAEDDFARFTRSLGGRLSGARAEMRRGEPEDVIPEFVVAEGIDLLVMGSVGRRGIPGFLIGNTAERVLPRLPCSVLVVKPAGPA